MVHKSKVQVPTSTAMRLCGTHSVCTSLLTLIFCFFQCVHLNSSRQDMSFLSRYLLRPLRELADDMESIAEHHFDAVSEIKD